MLNQSYQRIRDQVLERRFLMQQEGEIHLVSYQTSSPHQSQKRKHEEADPSNTPDNTQHCSYARILGESVTTNPAMRKSHLEVDQG